MSDIPSFPYRDLWEERALRSVANLTRQDGYEFLSVAPRIPIKTTVTCYPLEQDMGSRLYPRGFDVTFSIDEKLDEHLPGRLLIS